MSPEWAVATTAAAAAHLGLQLTVQLVVYPALADEAAQPDTDRAAAAHARHTGRMSRAVAPVYLALAATALGWVVTHPGPPALLFALLVLAVLGVTTFWAVPLHRRLLTVTTSPAARARLHARLRRADLARVALAVGLLAVAVLGAGLGASRPA